MLYQSLPRGEKTRY